MKKVLLLVALFVVPVVAYLFFASGVNSFIKLPVVTEKIPELSSNWQSLSGEPIQMKNKITILGFTGDNEQNIKGRIGNLAQIIYDKNKDFVDFQVVYIAPISLKDDVEKYLQFLSRDIDLKNLFFIFAQKSEIEEYHKKLGLVGKLNSDGGTSFIYIIDKELSLRGRKGENKDGVEEYKEGYNSSSQEDLKNEMADDVKVVLAEYRLALKKNNNKDNITN